MIRFRFKRFSHLTPDELYEILKLRQEIFVVEQDCVYLDNDDHDQAAFHLLGYDDQELIVYTRILGPGLLYNDYASIGRVVNKETHRGRGFGRQLMIASISRCRNLFPQIPIKITAQSYLLDFYQSLGFNKKGKEYLLDGIPHYDMILG